MEDMILKAGTNRGPLNRIVLVQDSKLQSRGKTGF